MDNSYLLEEILRDCPLCDTVHVIEKRRRMSGVLIKDEPVEFEETYFHCPICADSNQSDFVNAGMMDENLQLARNTYRKTHGLLTSDDIAAIRAIYDLSQIDLALLLVWNIETISRYETKAVQDEKSDQILRLFRDDPSFVLKQLDQQADLFSTEKINQIKTIILKNEKEKILEGMRTPFSDCIPADKVQW